MLWDYKEREIFLPGQAGGWKGTGKIMWWILDYRKFMLFGVGLKRWIDFRYAEILDTVYHLWLFI